MKRTFRYHLGRLWFPSVSGLILLYFVYHLIEGDHGYRAKRILEKQLEVAQNILNEKNALKESLEHKVDLLRSEHVDPDLLEERVRAMLNHVAPDEVVVLYENEGSDV